ncbi:AfsR/SARP family transcriptional regulator [Streptomyces cyanogenus]|uniref:Transcriptional regulatory protein EmbR n=1 Tax=Streptomyces cyanogenus TaxID=80860 RepID=A0ABX7TJ93_STRCY|nr:AfsR/SARP family transcriptional regulator [Streptomyces cyanogenus]QTD96700.1 Transcriptional regulatory protein EmbR [Streptomyces cyanogenus]
MRYEILGPLRVVDGDTVSSISARKIEIALAVLLIRSDQVVTHDQLIAEIWGDRPPRRATAGMHVYISQLRKFLHRPGRSENPVVTRQSGYLLRTGTDELDVGIFLDLVQDGRAAVRAERYEDAVQCFESALALWRGPVLGDLGDGPLVSGYVTWLTEARLECLEMLADVCLRVGRHRELVGRLYSLTAENPLCETFYRQLMVALYRSERQADALMVYQLARKTLHDELGLEPGQALRDVQQAILAADGRRLGVLAS